ncbi:MAG TPA: hypothetical protein VGE72_05375 [Azospirillum sp.]
MPRKRSADRFLARHGEWGIVRRGATLYRVRYDPAAKREERHSLGTTEIRVAEERLTLWLAEQYRPRNESPAAVPLAWVFTDYYDHYGCKRAAARSIKRSLALWTEFWDESMVDDVTPRRLEDFIRWLRERGLATGTIDSVLAYGRAAMRRAQRHQHLVAAPFVPAVGTTEDRQGARPLGRPLISAAEVAKILDAIPPRHDFLWRYCVLALNTMARPAAIVDLTSVQVDAINGVIHLNPPGRRQTKKRRPTVPITNTLRPWLEQWGAGPYIVRPPTVRPHAPDADPVASIRSALKKARARAYPGDVSQLPAPKTWADRRLREIACGPQGKHITPYSFRHTMGRELRRRRVPSDEIAIMLGHKPVGVKSTTLVYSPYDPDYCVHAVAAIDAFCAEIDGHLSGPRRLLIGAPPAAPARPGAAGLGQIWDRGNVIALKFRRKLSHD